MIDNLGGVISGDNSITLAATRDINIASTTADGKDTDGRVHGISNVGSVYLSGREVVRTPLEGEERPDQNNANRGQINISAGRDINLNAGMIVNDAMLPSDSASTPENAEETNPDPNRNLNPSNASANQTGGSTNLVAGRDINLGTVNTEQGHFTYFNDKNWRNEESRTEVGGQIQGTGDINVVAQDINITEARETRREENTYEFSQSGVTLGISSSVIGVLQTGEQMSQAAGRMDDGRMKALAAAATAASAYNSASSAAGGAPSVAFSLSVGSSKAESYSLQNEDSARGSTMNAGGNINLVATGKEGQAPSGNILIQGSQIEAGNNIALIANNQIDIRAAQNTSNEYNKSSSSSWSAGISYGSNGWGGSASSSKSSGSGYELEQEWTGSTVTAGNNLTVISGGCQFSGGQDIPLFTNNINGGEALFLNSDLYANNAKDEAYLGFYQQYVHNGQDRSTREATEILVTTLLENVVQNPGKTTGGILESVGKTALPVWQAIDYVGKLDSDVLQNEGIWAYLIGAAEQNEQEASVTGKLFINSASNIIDRIATPTQTDPNGILLIYDSNLSKLYGDDTRLLERTNIALDLGKVGGAIAVVGGIGKAAGNRVVQGAGKEAAGAIKDTAPPPKTSTPETSSPGGSGTNSGHAGGLNGDANVGTGNPATSSETVPYFRVEGGGSGNKTSQNRITANEDGSITINPGCQSQLCVSAGSADHARYYLTEKRSNGTVVVFEVDEMLHREIMSNKSPQGPVPGIIRDPNAPKGVDRGKAGSSVALELPQVRESLLERHSSNARVST